MDINEIIHFLNVSSSIYLSYHFIFFVQKCVQDKDHVFSCVIHYKIETQSFENLFLQNNSFPFTLLNQKWTLYEIKTLISLHLLF